MQVCYDRCCSFFEACTPSTRAFTGSSLDAYVIRRNRQGKNEEKRALFLYPRKEVADRFRAFVLPTASLHTFRSKLRFVYRLSHHSPWIELA